MITGDSSNGDCAFGANFLYKGNSSGIGKNWLIYIYDITNKQEYYFGISFAGRSLSFFNMFSGTDGWENIINHSDINYSYLIVYY